MLRSQGHLHLYFVFPDRNVCGSKSIVVLYTLFMATSMVWMILLSKAFAKHSEISAEIENLRNSRTILKGNGNSFSLKLKSSVNSQSRRYFYTWFGFCSTMSKMKIKNKSKTDCMVGSVKATAQPDLGVVFVIRVRELFCLSLLFLLCELCFVYNLFIYFFHKMTGCRFIFLCTSAVKKLCIWPTQLPAKLIFKMRLQAKNRCLFFIFSDTEEIRNLRVEQTLMKEKDSKIMANVTNLENYVSKVCVIKTCPCEWTLFSGKCYYFSNENRDWKKAREFCQSQDSDLAVINSDEELNYLKGKVRVDHLVGMSDLETEGVWKWLDGSLVDQRMWNPGEPNNEGKEDCGEMSNGKLNDIPCNIKQRWICEKTL
ncbi:CD209 antigen-like protein D isoform X2 [Huso huso]|uniref:CD209 antigen-like protein D isoform X2 n=1 Tax=Huso huso TaxID=61971 RepID=A0ABR0Y7X8_HUSHU